MDSAADGMIPLRSRGTCGEGETIPKVTFSRIPNDDEVVVRRDNVFLGKLIRTGGQGPVWANRDLKSALGRALTVDSTMAEAQAEVVRILYEQEGAPEPPPAAIAITFPGLPARGTWMQLWEALHKTGDTAIVRVTERGEGA